MDAPSLAAVLDSVRDAVAETEPPADPFQADALAGVAITLSDELRGLAASIHTDKRRLAAAWAKHEPDFDPDIEPPPPPPPPPPTKGSA